MLEIQLAEPVWHEVTLIPDERSTKGFAIPETEPLRGWLLIGEPGVIPITSGQIADDADLRGFVEAMAKEAGFYLVSLACTFRPPEGEHFKKAWVQVDLGRYDGVAQPLPIAWSMEPLRLEEGQETKWSAEIGAEVKLVNASIEGGRSTTGKRLVLEALNEGNPNPAWEFFEGISGVYRLKMVVRTPRGVKCGGAIKLSASIARRKMFFITYNEAIKESPQRFFDLNPVDHDHDSGHSDRQVSDRGMWNQPRLNKKIDDLRRQWELLDEKLNGLNKQEILETRFEEKLRLRNLIDDTQTQRDRVEAQLKDMESQLAKVDGDAK